MISADLARRFIERVTKYTDFNINIMDEHGIIIASRDPDRIGQYHAVAEEVLMSKSGIIEVEQDDIRNVRRGINMVIEVDGRREGVVGVTGAPKEIRPAALMTKMALETMLRYEKQQEERRRYENRKEQFIYLLTQVADAGHEELRTMAADLGFPEERIRIPILIKTENADTAELLQKLRASRLHSHQDFSIAPDAGHVLVFKAIPEQGEYLLREYRSYLTEYLSAIPGIPADRSAREAARDGKTVHAGTAEHASAGGKTDSANAAESAAASGLQIYIGTFQENYKQYYAAYRHCKWLESHVTSASQVVFFYDHISGYARSIAPMNELRSLFHIYEKRFPEKQCGQLIETVLTLQDTNYNFARAAEKLYIHKNTLVYRLGRIRELTGLDPAASSQDRAFLLAFAVYLSRR